MNKIKYCKFCDKEKPEEDFCKSGGYIKNICRDCQNKKQKQIYQDSKKTKQLEQEIERLNNRVKQLEKSIMISNKKHSFMTKDNIKLRTIINELEKWLEQEYAVVKANSIQEPNNPEWYIKWNERKNTLDKIKELKGSDKE